jgi:hypothetical protein
LIFDFGFSISHVGRVQILRVEFSKSIELNLALLGLSGMVPAVIGDAIVFDLLVAFLVEDLLHLVVNLPVEISDGRRFFVAVAD